MIGVFASGEAPGQQPDTLGGDSQLDSLLTLTVSSVSKYAQTAREAPSSVTVITAEEIQLYGFKTIEDVLKTVPGFYVSNDHDYGYVGVRGFGRPGDYNSRILLLVDGVVMNDPLFGGASTGTEFGFGLGSLERIEIVRGPASAVYGTGAMFGVVNLVLRNGVNYNGARASTELGSGGLRRAEVTWGTDWGKGLSLMVSGQAERSRGEDFYFKEFDSPGTNGGVARGLDGDRSASAVTQLRYRGFSLVAGLSSRTKDLATAPYGVVFDDPRAQTRDAQGFVALGAEASLSPTSTLNLRVYHSGTEYNAQFPYDVLSYVATSTRTTGSEILFHWDFPAGARLTAGAEIRRIAPAHGRLWTDEVTYLDKNVPHSVYSSFAEGEIQAFDRVRLVAGLRFDGFSDYRGSLSPRVAVVYAPSGTTTLKLMYGEAYRVPNLYEVHADDPLAGISANGGLLPERIRTIEAVCEQRITSILSASLSLHEYSLGNIIEQAADPVTLTTSYQNFGSVRTAGVEAELIAATRGGLRGRLSYCYDNSEILETATTLTNSPTNILRCSIGGPLTTWLTASGFVIHESARLTLRGPWTQGFWTVDARAAVTPFRFPVRFELGVRNLFDVQYELPVGPEFVQASMHQTGRAWTAGVYVDF